MTPARAPQSTAPNWKALLASILLVAPFLRALWLTMQAADATWLPANGDLLLFGAVIAAVLTDDSLRYGRPTRGFLLALAGCLAAIGVRQCGIRIGLQFEVRHRSIGPRQPHDDQPAGRSGLRYGTRVLPEARLPRRLPPLAHPGRDRAAP